MTDYHRIKLELSRNALTNKKKHDGVSAWSVWMNASQERFSTPPRRPFMLPIIWTEVLGFLELKDVVAFLTILRKLLKISFYPSAAHTRETLVYVALQAKPNTRSNMLLTGVVSANRSITLDALRNFVGFVKTVPMEITRTCLPDWICMDDCNVIKGSTCTVELGASGMQLSVPCAVCADIDLDTDDVCGTVVLTLCTACGAIREQCEACGSYCHSCNDTVCKKCMVPTSDDLCTACGFQCGGCNEVCLRDNGSYECAGLTADQPCPLSLGIRCDECQVGIMWCESCNRETCPACCAVNVCGSCDSCYCTTCRESVDCFGCGDAMCSMCRDINMTGCGVCLQLFCEVCAETTMQYCSCCDRAVCMLCESFNSCIACEERVCSLPSCSSVGQCWCCKRTTCANCCSASADKPVIDFDALLQAARTRQSNAVDAGAEAAKAAAEADMEIRCRWSTGSSEIYRDVCVARANCDCASIAA